MMKIFAFAVIFLSVLPALAARDSVAVFHRPEKVVVLVNEAGSSGRLQGWLNNLGISDEIYAESADGGININCGRNARAVSCNFRFLPSSLTQWGDRRLEAETSLQDLGLTAAADNEISFESDRQDRFVIRVTAGRIHFHAEKKPLAP